uniref:Glycosyl transferase n=1 Tax=Pectobacterium versatile TaxID=2488639 RepID=A0A855M6P1_9GAMM|nr:glycosyl transferase [Pectobacterium versatile]
MVKILISANTCWYLFNFRENTIRSLQENGYHVVVAAPEDDYASKLKRLGVEFHNITIDRNGKNPLKDIKTFFDFFVFYKRNKISCALNFTPKNNIYSTLAASMFGVPVINNIAGLGSMFIEESIISKIAKLLYKISQPKAGKIFFQNEEDRLLFLKNKISSEFVTDVLPGSGVDLERFKHTPSQNDKKIKFLLIARLIHEKGITYYANVAKELKDRYGDHVVFYLLGFIDEKNPASISKDMVDKWVTEGYINYLGTSDNVEDDIGRVDCVVLPSFYREGVPRVLLEAAAMGKPLITTDNVGCRETIIDGVNGFLCQTRSTKSLLSAIDKMINLSHEQRLLMGTRSRELVENKFDEKIVIDKYINAIKELI